MKPVPVYHRDGEALSSYLSQIERMPLLGREDELELARAYRIDGDQRAVQLLVEGHLRSVVRIARSFRGYGIPIADLVSEGNVGLLEAAKRFEPERGLRFFTYARYWVRACILAHVLKHWSVVDMGTSALQSKLFFRLQAERARLATKLGDSDESIAARLAVQFDTSEEHVRLTLNRLGRRDASLDAPVSADGGSATLLDLVADHDQSTQEEMTAAQETVRRVRRAVARVLPDLDRRERLIVSERLLPAGDAASLAEIGRTLGLTRERVRQIEVVVKRKLREVLLESQPPTRLAELAPVPRAA